VYPKKNTATGPRQKEEPGGGAPGLYHCRELTTGGVAEEVKTGERGRRPAGKSVISDRSIRGKGEDGPEERPHKTARSKKNYQKRKEAKN